MSFKTNSFPSIRTNALWDGQIRSSHVLSWEGMNVSEISYYLQNKSVSLTTGPAQWMLKLTEAKGLPRVPAEISCLPIPSPLLLHMVSNYTLYITKERFVGLECCSPSGWNLGHIPIPIHQEFDARQEILQCSLARLFYRLWKYNQRWTCESDRYFKTFWNKNSYWIHGR